MIGDARVCMRGREDMRMYVCAQVDDLLIVGKPESVRQLKRDMLPEYTMVRKATFPHWIRHHINEIAQNSSVTEEIQRRQ